MTLELSLYSVGFGFLNWFIARQFQLVGPIEIIQNEPLRILYLMLISVVIGLILTIGIIGYRHMLDWFSKRSRAIKEVRERQSKGYNKSTIPVWPDIIQEHLDIAKSSLGRKYSVTVKVFLKDPFNGTKTVEGLVYQIDLEKPSDIIITPQYTVQCKDRSQLIELLEQNKSEIVAELQNNKNYYNVIKSFTHHRLENAQADEIIKKLKDAEDTEEFFNILAKIDLSKYIKGITNSLISIGSTYIVKHTKTEIYIPYDNIRGVEVINYQAFYAVSIIENGGEIVLPKLYEKEELPFLKKVIAEP